MRSGPRLIAVKGVPQPGDLATFFTNLAILDSDPEDARAAGEIRQILHRWAPPPGLLERSFLACAVPLLMLRVAGPSRLCACPTAAADGDHELCLQPSRRSKPCPALCGQPPLDLWEYRPTVVDRGGNVRLSAFLMNA